MAQSDLDLIANINIGNEREFNRRLNRISNRRIDLNTKKGELALGRITGKADEFTKSLEASNARVIAFGASVAIIEGVRRSFANLVKTVVEVESQLTAINSIFGRSSQSISKFGDELFGIARQTGQSFSEVAKTAQEFARQGLSVEETLSRTNSALILTRLTTLKGDEAVAALTATINGFEKQALSASQVINKLRAVETSFAVSSGDLADALARSASVAQGAGVSFDELLGVITAIKQRTGLGGATIGQGLKTVFTRLNLPTRIQQLRELGVTVDESANGLEKLRQVALAVKKAQDQGNQSLATQIGTIAAGQFQISKISAAFDDLASQYSVTDAAAQKSIKATDEAIRANEEYNQTIASVSNSIKENFGQIFNTIGELGAQDGIRDLLQDVNSFLSALRGEKVSSSPIIGLINDLVIKANEFGLLADAAKGFINVLAGPAAIAAIGVLSNLIKNTALQGGKSILSLTGINSALEKRKQNQAAISSLLRQATNEELKQFQLAENQAKKEAVILSILQRQLAVQKAQELTAVRTAEALRLQGLNLSVTQGGYNVNRNLARRGISRMSGSASSFAGGRNPVEEEMSSVRRGVGGASPNASIKIIPDFNYGSGKKAPAVVNSDEIYIPSKSGDIVLNKDMINGAKNFAFGSKVNLSNKEIRDAEERVRKGQDLTQRQVSRIRVASLQGQGAAIPTFLKRYVENASKKASSERVRNFTQDDLFMSEKRKRDVAIDRQRKMEKRRIVPLGGTFKGGKTGFTVGGGPRLALPGEVAYSNVKSGQGVLTGQEYANRFINEPLSGQKREGRSSFQPKPKMDKKELLDRAKRATAKGIVGKMERQSFWQGQSVSETVRGQIFKEEVAKELNAFKKRNKITDKDFFDKTPEGRQLKNNIEKAVSGSIQGQQFEIDKAIADKQVEAARQTIQKDTGFKRAKKGLGFKFNTLGKVEKNILSDKELNPIARRQIQEDIQNRKFARNQRMTQGAFLGSFALSAAAPFAGRMAGGRETTSGRVTEGLLSGGASGLALGAMFGPKGAIIGGAAGAIGGAASGFMGGGKSESARLGEELEELQEKFSDTSRVIDGYMNAQDNLNQLLESGSFTARQLKQAEDSVSNFFNVLQKENPLLAERFSKASTPSEMSDIQAEFEKKRADAEQSIQSAKDTASFVESKQSDLGNFFSSASDFTKAFDEVWFGSGMLSKITPASLSMRGGSSFMGDVAGANAATFSERDILNLSSSIVKNTDLSSLWKNIEESGKTFEEFFQDIARTTKGFNSREFETFVKALGLSGEFSESLRKFMREMDMGSSVVSQAFSRALKPLEQMNRNELLKNLSVNSRMASFDTSQKQIDILGLMASQNRLAGARSDINNQLGFQASKANLSLDEFVAGKPLTSRKQRIERNELGSEISKRERLFFEDYGNKVQGLLQKLLTSDSAEMGGKGSEIFSKLEQIVSGDLNGFTGLEELVSGNSELKSELKDLKNEASASLAELKMQNQKQEEALEIQQSQERILENLSGFRNRTEGRLGQSLDSLLGRGDETISGRVRSSMGITDEERKKELADPDSGINVYLKDAANEQRKGFEEVIKGLPQNLQSQARSVVERGLRESTYGENGLDMSDVSGRGEFALERLKQFIMNIPEGFVTPEQQNRLNLGTESLGLGFGKQKDALQRELDYTNFGDILGRPSDIKSGGDGVDTGDVGIVEKRILMAVEDLTNALSQKQAAIEATQEAQNATLENVREISEKVAAIMEKGLDTTVSFNDKISITFEEGGEMITKQFDSYEEAFKALKQRVKRIEDSLTGKPKPDVVE